MAKIFKIFGYIKDINSKVTQNDIQLLFDKYINIYHLKCKQSKEFEWHDDIDINFIDAKQEDFEKYFDEELIIKSPSNLDTNEYNELVNALKNMPNDGVVVPVNVEIEKRDQSTTKILQNEIQDIIIENSSDMIANEILTQLKLKGFRFR